jgi:hypothetical protein
VRSLALSDRSLVRSVDSVEPDQLDIRWQVYILCSMCFIVSAVAATAGKVVLEVLHDWIRLLNVLTYPEHACQVLNGEAP